MSELQPLRHRQFAPAHLIDAGATPWIDSATPGKRSRPLRFLDNDAGFVEIMDLLPGVALPLHRHSGEVHAWNLAGARRLCTGETVQAGQYVYEPPGNTDWWIAVGDVPLQVLVVVMGNVEYLNPDGSVRLRVDAATQRAEYLAWCASHGVPALELG